jgi:opacity protein-like surface antigen
MMRLHKIVLPLALLLLCTCTTTAHAAERMKVGFMMDFVTGVTIPIGDSDYKNFADASFKMGLRVGAVLYITDRFGIAPEGEFDFIVLEPDKTDFPSVSVGQANTSTAIYRERGLFGARYIINFGIGSFYLRTMLGVDHIGATTSVYVPVIGTTSASISSTGFALEPGAGVQFNVIRHLVVGFTTGFPIGFHDFGNNSRKFTSVDVDFLGVVGVRL